MATAIQPTDSTTTMSGSEQTVDIPDKVSAIRIHVDGSANVSYGWTAGTRNNKFLAGAVEWWTEASGRGNRRMYVSGTASDVLRIEFHYSKSQA